jgi:DNA-binding transcriptional ArsR family regulator
MSLLPSTDDASAEQEGDIQVLGVEEDETASVFSALSSDTARRVLTALYNDPAPPSELADRLDMSVQNVSYHLKNLRDAGLVEVADTRYSEKGKEMKVYAPVDTPMVCFWALRSERPDFLACSSDSLAQLACSSSPPRFCISTRELGVWGVAMGAENRPYWNCCPFPVSNSFSVASSSSR